MDATHLILAVDSTQVNSAAQALDRMAASGTKAETAAASIAKASTDSGRAIATLLPATSKAAVGFKDLASAQAELGPAAARQLAAVLGPLDAAQAKARGAAAAFAEMGAEATVAGSQASKALGQATASITPRTVASLSPATGVAPQAAIIAAAGTAAGTTASQVEALAKASRLATFQSQQLNYQLHDFFVQVASGQSPVTAFVQQGSQLSGTFGGAGGAFKAVLEKIMPLRVVLGGAAGAAAALGFAFYEGSKQSKEFATALALTNNFAGQTEGQFNALAKTVSATTGDTVGNVREIGQALLTTGEIGPQAFAAATTAAVGYGKATGKTAEEVAKAFSDMARSPSKFAVEANRQLNFITAAQHQTIKAFEDNGRAADAQGIIYDALNARFGNVNQNLGTLERALNVGKSAWSSFWNAALDIGRTQTVEDKITAVDARLRALNSAPADNRNPFAAPPQSRTAELQNQNNAAPKAALENERSILIRRQFRETENAFAQANRADVEKAGIAARTFGERALESAKDVSALNKALAENQRQFKAAAEAKVPFTAAQQKAIDDDTRKKFAPPKVPKNNEAEQVRRETLAADLRGYQDALQKERDALVFQNRFLQGEYQVGNLSLRDYYEQQRATTAAGVASEIEELNKRKERLAAERRDVQDKDPSEAVRLKREIDDATRQQERLRSSAAREVILSNQQEGESYRHLVDQVMGYRATLLQLQGDELGAARIRSKQAEDQGLLLARQATQPSTPGAFARLEKQQEAGTDLFSQVAARKRLTDENDALTESKRKTSIVNQQLQIEEERITLAQRVGSASENESLQRIGEARLRAIPEMERQVDELERIAKSRPLDLQLTIDASRARLELDKMKAESTLLKDKFDNLFKDAGANAVESLLNGGSLKNAGKQFLQQITQSFNKDTAKDFSKAVFGEGGIFGKVGATLAGDKQPAGGFGGQLAELLGLKRQVNGIDDGIAGSFGIDAKAEAANRRQIVDLFKPPTIDTSSVMASLESLQSVGINPTIDAFTRLAQVVGDAADRNGLRPDAGSSSTDPNAITTAGDFARFDRKTSGEQSIADLFKDAGDANEGAAQSADAFAKTTDLAAQSALSLAMAASRGGGALSVLPSIIAAIEAASAASSASGGGGGFFGSLLSLFGAGGGASAGASVSEAAEIAALFAHTGGVVGRIGDVRNVTSNVFNSAAKYHEGGLVAGPAVKGLAANEVPAVLMGGPKGTREEVLHASDPRHSDNLSPALLKLIQVRPNTVKTLIERSYETVGGPLAAVANARLRTVEKYHSGGIVGAKTESAATWLPHTALGGRNYLMTSSQDDRVKNEPARGGDTYHNHQTIQVQGAVDKRTEQQIFAAAYGGGERAFRRNRV